jgi:hypothetical protein
MTHIYLFLVLCMDQQCTERNGFIRDSYESPAHAVADARADCEEFAKLGRKFLAAMPREGESVSCLTMQQIRALNFKPIAQGGSL